MADPLADPRLEAWVLGALLDSSGPIFQSNPADLIAIGGLTLDLFTQPVLEAVFSCIRVLADERKPATAQTVWALLRPASQGRLDFARLEQLQAGNTIGPEEFGQLCDKLRALKSRRDLRALAEKIKASAESETTPPSEIARSSEELLRAVSAGGAGTRSAADELFAFMDEVDDIKAGKRCPEVSTGIDIIDKVLGGYAANLNLIAGLESVGKSAVAAESILACLQRGMRVGLFGLEDGVRWLIRRQVSRMINAPVGRLFYPLSPEQEARLQSAGNELHPLLERLLISTEGGIKPGALVAQANRWIVKDKAQIIFVDHGGEVAHEAGRDRYDLAVAQTYRQLRDLAVRTGVPIVVLCHLNTEAEKREGPPQRGDIAESRYIIRMARRALALWVKDGQLRATAIKRTDGPPGQTAVLERDAEHALIKRAGGWMLDESAEEKTKRKARRAWSDKKTPEDDDECQPSQRSLLD